MKVAFWCSDKYHERELAKSFIAGVTVLGDEGFIVPTAEDFVIGDYDVACMVGVKSRELFYAHRKAGIRVIYLDKGYLRHRRVGVVAWEYWRTSVDDHSPTEWLGKVKMPFDRATDQGLKFVPWKGDGSHIVLDGSSEKYHAFFGLEHPTEYARSIVASIRRECDLPIVYRPKPSWKNATKIGGTIYSPASESFAEVLQDAHVVVTHGSNAGFEAMCAGVPTIVLGNACVRTLSSTSIGDIMKPRLASSSERAQFLANLAYCQWTLAEMTAGKAWRALRQQLDS